MNHKMICEECGWKGDLTEVLTAPSPFDEELILNGCPQCREANTVSSACQIEGCWEPVTTGKPLADGRYVHVCDKHYKESSV